MISRLKREHNKKENSGGEKLHMQEFLLDCFVYAFCLHILLALHFTSCLPYFSLDWGWRGHSARLLAFAGGFTLHFCLFDFDFST